MILIAHSLIGSALTRSFGGKAVLFFSGLISHYILDMIPHWHYNMPRVEKFTKREFDDKTIGFKKEYLPDVVRIAVDLAVGFSLSAYFFGFNVNVIFAVFGAVLPDLLVGSSRFINFYPLKVHSRFHRWVHARTRLDDKPIFGITSQAVIVLAVVLALAFY